MKLHGNAALSLIGRRRMVLRVVEQGWSVTQAAAAAEVSGRDVLASGSRRYLADAAAGSAGSLVGASVVAQPHGGAHDRGDRGAAAAAVHRPGDRRGSDRPLSTVSGILTRIGMGQLGRLGLEPAVRYERARPGELIHIDVKKLGPHPGRRGKAHHRRRRATTRPTLTDAAGVDARSSAGITCTSRSTTPPAWPTSRSSTTRRR